MARLREKLAKFGIENVVTVWGLAINGRTERQEELCAGGSRRVERGDLSAPIEPHGSAQQRKILRGLEKLRVSTLEQQIAHARAIEQNKLAIASVAHDVKTPLALISGYAECLQDGMDDKDYPALITEKTEQLNGLVLKLVETSKHEIEEIDSLKEKVNTRTFFGAVLDKYEQLAKTKNISYKVRRIPPPRYTRTGGSWSASFRTSSPTR